MAVNSENSFVRSGRQYPQDYMNLDVVQPPAALRDHDYVVNGTDDLTASRYLSKEFFDEESKVWAKVWQVACHVTEVPSVGDTYVHDILDWSIVLVRGEDEVVRGFYNSCLHRATQLRCESGNVADLRCPFHGWTWGLKGELQDLPEEWDFPGVRERVSKLPSVRVETWNEWVFICMDAEAPSLAEYLENLPDHAAQIRPLRRKIDVHVQKRVRANWKVALEAFLEGYHCVQSHPQTAIATDCYDNEVSVYRNNRHVSRLITPIAVPGSGAGFDVTEQDVLDNVLSDRFKSDDMPRLIEGERARPVVADAMRATKQREFGSDLTDVSEAEMLDGIEYHVFPNFSYWAGYGVPLAYRFRPVSDDPGVSIMDLYVFSPLGGEEEDCPPAPEPILLGLDDRYINVEQLGRFALVMEQDMQNIERMQRGLRASHKGAITLGIYQEAIIRKYHRVLDEYMSSVEGLK